MQDLVDKYFYQLFLTVVVPCTWVGVSQLEAERRIKQQQLEITLGTSIYDHIERRKKEQKMTKEKVRLTVCDKREREKERKKERKN